ncbi:sucrose-phosphate synthase-like [Raphidocelis subcapitata]|uniref:sucrose-phosphate synthase n=1 Tax=Raphidocelis subcapitata TaxID=307507 RepID=A0A2V0NZB9_9CHLO|nr:sucrose-phosphate synthase-like [Raphidocelis subcapitata]|eukprot:GBF90940.1 sucrose-phosphate synthase-like [Raphidocelis subcapitata]
MSSRANGWVDSYIDALLSTGLSTESARIAAEQAKGAPDDVEQEAANIAAKYYVHQILAMDEESIQQAYLKVRARSNVKTAGERDARLEHITWRVWTMRRRAAAARLRPIDESPDPSVVPDLRSDEGGGGGGAVDEEELTKLYGRRPRPASDAPRAPASDAASSEAAEREQRLLLRRLSIPPRGGAAGAELLSESSEEAAAATPTTEAVPATPPGGLAALAGSGLNLGEDRVPKLYVVLISMHGLVRGDQMELGKDPDTGGQVKYVVELARALARHPAVHRVDLLTRLIADPSVHKDYSAREEALDEPVGALGGARIVRIQCGPPDKYIRKEMLWPHVREFADNALAHVAKTLAALAAAGEVCELYDIHGHYADAGEAAALMSFTLGSDMVLTGHSLGRNKLDHLLKSRTMSRREIEAAYAVTRRIEGEERALDAASLVFTSTQQEVKDQWGLYDGYNAALARILQDRPRAGRHFPVMAVIPPGLDFSNLKVDCPPDPWQQLAAAAAVSGTRSRRASVSAAAGGGAEEAAGDGAAKQPPSATGLSRRGSSPSAAAAHSAAAADASPLAPAGPEEDPPIWQEIFRFLRNPRKPVILAMSRPDAKKNITALVRAYGESRPLRDIANLVLIMGNREVIDGMAPGSARVLESVLKLVDAYDLYGCVAYPKRHSQDDISDIYLLPHHTRGVFVNIALQEPFGLTLIEAAAHGVPIVATTHGGPVDIIHTLHNGILVAPTDTRAVSDALLKLLTDPGLWEQYATSGRDNINAYSWPSHCMRCLCAIEKEKLKAAARRKTAMRATYSYDLDEIADQLTGLTATGSAALDPGAIAARASSDLGPAPPTLDAPPAAVDDSLLGTSPRVRSLAASSVPLIAAAPGMAPPPSPRQPTGRSSLDGPPTAANGDRAVAQPRSQLAPKSKYLVLLLDGADSAARLAALVARKGKSMLAAAAGAGQTVGVGVASAYGLGDTLRLLAGAGLSAGDVDFAVTDCGSQIWLAGAASARAPGAAAGAAAEACAADESYDAHIDHNWDKISVRRLLAHLLAQPGIFAGLAGGAAAPPPLRVSVDTETGSHHLLLTLRRRNAPAGGAAAPPLAPEALLALVSRIKRRFRSSGVRAQIAAQLEADGAARLHITPLRASRALALRYLAHRHGVPLADLVFVSCAREMAPGAPARFAASDAEDLVAGVQGVLVLPPPPAAGDGAAVAAASAGFAVDLEPYSHDGRIQLMPAAAS